jgi:hypothetical protein
VRLALYVSLKNIFDGVGGQDVSNGTPLDPPLFWLDNIFNVKIVHTMPVSLANGMCDFTAINLYFYQYIHYIAM